MRTAPLAGLLVPAGAAGLIGILWVGAYLVILDRQGSDLAPRSIFYAAFVATMAVFSVGGSMPLAADRVARPMLAAATAGFSVAGLLALMSIGLPLLAAALLALAAAMRRGVRGRSAVGAMALTVVTFLAGIQLTWPI